MTRRRIPEEVCRACGVPRPRDGGPDPCLGLLPGVESACCGHGNRRGCYVQLESRDPPPFSWQRYWRSYLKGLVVLRGDEAWKFLRRLDGDPAPLVWEDGDTLDGWICRS